MSSEEIRERVAKDLEISSSSDDCSPPRSQHSLINLTPVKMSRPKPGSSKLYSPTDSSQTEGGETVAARCTPAPTRRPFVRPLGLDDSPSTDSDPMGVEEFGNRTAFDPPPLWRQPSVIGGYVHPETAQPSPPLWYRTSGMVFSERTVKRNEAFWDDRRQAADAAEQKVSVVHKIVI